MRQNEFFPTTSAHDARTHAREPYSAGARRWRRWLQEGRKIHEKGLREAIERYFRSISRTIPARDDTGGIIRNDDGEEIKVVQFVVPPSVTGMCLYLGIDRSTWQNYADAALHPELAGICQGARTRIEAYLEQELLTREKGVQGIIFNLQNNYGWKQKQEVELGKDTRESMKHAATYHEKLALLRADDGESECDEDEVDGL